MGKTVHIWQMYGSHGRSGVNLCGDVTYMEYGAIMRSITMAVYYPWLEIHKNIWDM